jgi:hypothetical protein
MKVTIDLTKGEWCELANAISSKASDIRRGRYGDRDEEEDFDPEEWAAELESAYQKVTVALDEEGIVY